MRGLYVEYPVKKLSAKNMFIGSMIKLVNEFGHIKKNIFLINSLRQ